MKSTTDKGPMWRLARLKEDAQAPGRIFQMLTQTGVGFPKAALPALARELEVPKGSFVEWFTSEHPGLYEAALRVIAADLAIKAAEAAIEATPEDVQVKRLQADVFLKLASRFDRARYGDQGPQARSEIVVMDIGLLGEAGKLLERLRPAPRLPEKVVSEQRAEGTKNES